MLREMLYLSDSWFIEYYEDNKETNLRLFKLKLAHIFNDVDDNLFKEIFGFTSVELADKLINTTSKEDSQMIIDHIEIKKDKIFEREYGKFVIQDFGENTYSKNSKYNFFFVFPIYKRARYKNESNIS